MEHISQKGDMKQAEDTRERRLVPSYEDDLLLALVVVAGAGAAEVGEGLGSVEDEAAVEEDGDSGLGRVRVRVGVGGPRALWKGPNASPPLAHNNDAVHFRVY